jgi:hypothetical protein
MPQTLAQMVRAKHPGAYDDLSDQALEAKIHAKFPGAYDDLPSTPASSESAQPEGSAASRFLSNAGAMLNPVTMVQGLGQAIAHPIDTGTALVKAQGAQFGKAADEFRQGRYSEAVGHTMAGALPLIGPAAANVGEQIGAGDVAGGLGAATGLVGGMVAPGMVARGVKNLRVPALAANRSAAAVEAIEAGQRAGVPIDAATATGNRFVAAAQHAADRSLGGSGIAGKAAEAQAQGLATMGEQLAAKGHALPVTAEQAGQGVKDAVLGQVREHGGLANEAYDALRQIEADPKHLRTIPAAPLKGAAAAQGAESSYTGRFAKPGASTEDLFQGVLGDARRNGFVGSADDLRAEFSDRLRSGREGLKESSGAASEVDADALLRDIRKLGGVSDKGGVWSDLNELDPRFRSTIKRKGGLGLDDLADQLRQDPKWQPIVEDAEHLGRLLDNFSRGLKGKQVAAGGELERALSVSGVEPGAQWWKAGGGEPVTMALPVDLRPARAALKPIYDDLLRQSKLTSFAPESGKARALDALDRLLQNDSTHAPLSTVDAALSDLKSFTRAGRAGDVPELATAGQGAAKLAIGHLESAVQKTAAAADPEALAVLKVGRSATVAKYAAADALEALNAEPVRAYGQLTAAKDAAIGQLREVAKHAPAELPKIGRAFLDDLLGQAQAEGGFSKVGTIAAKWEKLGPETKRMLYKDPGYVSELDKFFHLAKLTAVNANPSGTAHVAAAAGQGAALATAVGTVNPVLAVTTVAGPYAVSKFLHSAAGVRLLTKGLKIPVGNAAARTAYLGELAGFAQRNGVSLTPATVDDRKPGDVYMTIR